MSKDGTTAATADVAASPTVIIWDIKTCNVSAVLTDLGGSPAVALDFSDDGTKLLVATTDSSGMVSVFDVASHVKLFSSSVSALGTVYNAKW